MGEQVAARLKKKTTDVSLLNINTGIGKGALSETEWNQKRIDKSDANPYQPGSAVHKLVLPVI